MRGQLIEPSLNLTDITNWEFVSGLTSIFLPITSKKIDIVFL